ncbi:hypothetical protein [Hyalangium minutum]|uniref:Lipoprotein n=1 Tax=Hyalangium minutum TaxID=394096 RepID=A0A085W2Q1_9BACT|nr:hypothetical protein [Hyalangium minutum]KFE61964.1 hypothetical protein DB31_4407 [Hyalangium minutum]
MPGRTNFSRIPLRPAALSWLLTSALMGCGGPELEQSAEAPKAVQSFALSYPDGASKTVTSRRVVYKDASGTYRSAPGFEAFRAVGAADGDLYPVRISEVDVPSVRNALVVMSAGQKISSSGHTSGLTGQASNWDASCGDVSCPNVTLDGRSLAMKLRALGWLPPATTWMAVVNDNNFDHLSDSGTKQQLLDGFVRWLEEQVRPETRTIYLAGSSRGGCLVMRMAQALRNNPSLDGIDLYVSSFDGVCKYTQGELGTFGTKINNPVRPWGTAYGGWATDLSAQFPRKGRLHIFHIAGGEEVAPLTGIRAFSAYSGTPPSTGTGLDWGWYKQTWVQWKHKEIGNPYTEPSSSNQPRVISETLDAQLTWLDSFL